jgi:hypothetical protein
MRKLLLALFLLLATSALAADVTGNWTGSADANGNTRDVYLVLKQSATGITGTAGYSATEQYPFENGRLEGDKIKFEIVSSDESYTFELVPDGQGLKGKVEIRRGDNKQTATLTLKRATS